MEETIVWFRAGAVCVTPYSVMMALGLAAGVALCVLCAARWTEAKAQSVLSAALCAGVGAIIGGHLLYCLAMLPSILVDFQSGLSLLYRLHMGGYTLYGGILGGLLAVRLYTLATKQKTAPILDALTPGALLALAVGRAAEFFTDQGRGDYLDDLENAALCRFPMAVAKEYADFDYVEWRYAVFVWEALAAAVILIAALALLCRGRRAGRVTEAALTLVSAAQIVLEQLRQDGFLRFGFIRVTQIAAILTIAVVLALRITRAVRREGFTMWQAVRLLLFGVSVAVVILVEFAYDKPQALPALRICLMALAALCVWALALRIRAHKGVAVAAALAAVSVAVCVTLTMLLTQNLMWESAVLTSSMTVALIAIAAAALCGGSNEKEHA